VKGNIKPTAREAEPGPAKSSLLKTAAIAGALGVATWLLTPFLFPTKVPEDFPKLPDLQTLNPDVRKQIQTADQEARRRPASAEAVGKLGMAYQANLLLDPAERAYRIAARLAPGDYQWVYSQAFLQEEKGDEKDQVKLLQQTLKLKPDHIPSLLKLADGYFKLDRLDEATHYYELAARAPGGAATLQSTVGLARVAVRRKEWSKVIERISPALAAYSHVLPLQEMLHEAYAGLGKTDQAAEASRNMALAKWKVVPPPDDPINEQLIGLCYTPTRLLKQAGLLSRLGYPDKALQLARRASQAEPADADVRNFLSKTLLTFYGDKPDAVEESLTQLSECLRLRPNDLVPLWLYTSDFFETPKSPAAVERLSALLRPHANRDEAHFYLGLVADAKGETTEAASQYQAALKIDPNNSAAYNKLGLILSQDGKLDDAVRHFQKAIQLKPLNSGARFNLAVALMQRGSYGQAATELNEVLRANPHDAAAHFCLGFTFLYSRRIDEAIPKFREGLRYKPDDADAHYGLASAFAAQRKRPEAVAEVREALRLRPNFPAAQEMLQQLER
jgi:superkiller protein 3